MDCSPPGSYIHRILPATIREWVVMPSSRGSSRPRDRTQVSPFAGRFFTVWATREALSVTWRLIKTPSLDPTQEFLTLHFQQVPGDAYVAGSGTTVWGQNRTVTNLIFEDGHYITLLTKVHLVKAMVFPVVMNGCESWTIKRAEHWRTDAFELWCWKRRLRVPWTVRRSNQFILKEISLEHSLEGLMLRLKLQYFGHLMQRTDSLKKTLMLGTIEGWRRRGWQRVRWLDSITDSMDMSLSKLRYIYSEGQGSLACCSSRGRRVRHDWVTEQQ